MNVKAMAALLASASASAATVAADGVFAAADQALWIDRFNYFRMTGLPWSAGDMRRMGWDDALAASAAASAASCAAAPAAGVNVFSASANSSSLSLVDQAVSDWIVATSLSTLATLDAPSGPGVGVGTGVYNAYSQSVWAATSAVGCASATCAGKAVVVCQFSPAGNDGASPWYTHADQGSLCPEGTVSSAGLCIVEGDAANAPIAAIPAGQEAYQVFPSYVADMQTVLVESARAVASGTTLAPSATTTSPSTTTTSPSATASAPSATTKTPSTTTSSSSSSSGKATTATFADASGSDSVSPGTVKASSADGSTFGNEVSSPSVGTAAAGDGASTTTTAESATTASTTTTTTTDDSSAAETSGSGGTSVSANNKSGDSSSGVSATGMAGVIVVAVGAVAGVAVFVSYRKNQQRQRDIMQNGGIHVL